MDEPIRRVIKERLRSLRAARNWTLKQVAEMIDTSEPTVGRWEDYEQDSVPPSNKLSRLADVYEVSSDYLLGRSAHPTGLPVSRWMIDGEEVDAILKAHSLADLEPWLPDGPTASLEDYAFEIPREPRILTRAQFTMLQKKLDAVITRLRSRKVR